MEEHKVGEVFKLGKFKAKPKITKTNSCGNCLFSDKHCGYLQSDGFLEPCTPTLRQDGKDVIFVEVK
jgi:hypothetical protein